MLGYVHLQHPTMILPMPFFIYNCNNCNVCNVCNFDADLLFSILFLISNCNYFCEDGITARSAVVWLNVDGAAFFTSCPSLTVVGSLSLLSRTVKTVCAETHNLGRHKCTCVPFKMGNDASFQYHEPVVFPHHSRFRTIQPGGFHDALICVALH